MSDSPCIFDDLRGACPHGLLEWEACTACLRAERDEALAQADRLLMGDAYRDITAERDRLRALLRECLNHIARESHATTAEFALRGRIAYALESADAVD